jgi:hypothetical protein
MKRYSVRVMCLCITKQKRGKFDVILLFAFSISLYSISHACIVSRAFGVAGQFGFDAVFNSRTIKNVAVSTFLSSCTVKNGVMTFRKRYYILR